MLDWVEDHFPEVGLDILKSTNVFPGNVGDLDDSLTKTGWVAGALGEFEVLVGHIHGVEDFSVDCVVVNVDDVHLLSDALEGGLLTD